MENRIQQRSEAISKIMQNLGKVHTMLKRAEDKNNSRF